MDKKGRFGEFGGQYVPETVMNAVCELENAYDKYKDEVLPEIMDYLKEHLENRELWKGVPIHSDGKVQLRAFCPAEAYGYIAVFHFRYHPCHGTIVRFFIIPHDAHGICAGDFTVFSIRDSYGICMVKDFHGFCQIAAKPVGPGPLYKRGKLPRAFPDWRS